MHQNYMAGDIRIAPNRKGGRILLVDKTGGQVAYLWGRDGHDGTPNAERIALCWNSHDKMKEAIHRAAMAIGRIPTWGDGLDDDVRDDLYRALAGLDEVRGNE